MDGISGIITVFSIVAAFYGALLTVFMVVLSALWLRMGNVQQELGGVAAGVRLLQDEMHRNNNDLREDVQNSQNLLREEFQSSQSLLREEFQSSQSLLREEFQRSQEQFREEVVRSQEQFREEVVRSLDHLREDMQRSHNQLMRAILAHSHRDDGRPTFDLPPDFEPTPVDD